MFRVNKVWTRWLLLFWRRDLPLCFVDLISYFSIHLKLTIIYTEYLKSLKKEMNKKYVRIIKQDWPLPSRDDKIWFLHLLFFFPFILFSILVFTFLFSVLFSFIFYSIFSFVCSFFFFLSFVYNLFLSFSFSLFISSLCSLSGWCFFLANSQTHFLTFSSEIFMFSQLTDNIRIY